MCNDSEFDRIGAIFCTLLDYLINCVRAVKAGNEDLVSMQFYQQSVLGETELGGTAKTFEIVLVVVAENYFLFN